MRLRRFTVEGFAQLDRVEVAFRDDAPNLVIGPNEAGKSHLMQAFLGMFFPLDRASDLLPWDGPQDMRGVLEFVDADEQPVRLERSFITNDVLVTIGQREPWKGKVKGGTPDAVRFSDCLQNWLGFRDRELFCSTTFVRQADVILQGHGNALASQVKELITGTQETNYDRVLEALEKELDTVRMRPRAHKQRELELKNAELLSLKQEAEQAQRQHDDHATVNHRLSEVRQQVEAKQRECAAIQRSLRAASDLVDIEARLHAADAAFQREHAARDRYEELNARLLQAQQSSLRLAAYARVDEAVLARADARVQAATEVNAEYARRAAPDLDALGRLEQAVARAEAALNRLPSWPDDLPIEVIRAARREGQSVTPAAKRSGPRWLVVGGIAAVGLLLGILVTPIFVVLILAAVVYAGAALSGMLSGGAGDATVTSPSARDHLRDLLARVNATSVEEAERRWEEIAGARSQVAAARTDLDRALRGCGVATLEQARDLDARIRSARDDLARAQQERDRILRDLGVQSSAQAAAGLREYRDACAEQDIVRAKIGELGSEDDIVARRSEAGAAQARLQFQVRDLLDRNPDLKALGSPQARASHVAALSSRLETLRTEIEASQQEVVELRGQLADLGGTGMVDLPLLLDRIREIEDEVVRLARKANALEIARTELSGAVAHFRDHCLGGVMQDTSGFLQAITDGRYDAVEVDADTLAPAVFSGDRRVQASVLSRGVQDQLYFALRIALARAIASGRTLPLMLDDPFVNFDPARREQALMLLRGLVDRTQVLLFTCDPWYTTWIAPVLELPDAARSSVQRPSADVA